MNKTELIETIAAKTGASKKLSGKMLDAALGSIVDSVASGDAVRLVGFGTFSQTDRKPREGRNPKTGVTVSIAAVTVPKFVAGADFKRKVADVPIATYICAVK